MASSSPGDNAIAVMAGALSASRVGPGLSFVPMTMTATARAPLHHTGLASGLLNTSRQVAGAVGLAAMATIAASAAYDHGPAVILSAGLTSGYDRAFAVSAAILAVGAALALLLPRPTDVGTVSAQVAGEVRGQFCRLTLGLGNPTDRAGRMSIRRVGEHGVRSTVGLEPGGREAEHLIAELTHTDERALRHRPGNPGTAAPAQRTATACCDIDRRVHRPTRRDAEQ